MLGMLVAYDAGGNVVATLDYMVSHNSDGEVTGLVDFAAHEAAGGSLTDIWTVSNAVGSGTWPEWIGSRAHDFRVELASGRVNALVHKGSGHRRVRATVEAAIARRITDAGDAPADIRDLVGGPDRPLPLDEEGRARVPTVRGQPALPLAVVRHG